MLPATTTVWPLVSMKPAALPASPSSSTVRVAASVSESQARSPPCALRVVSPS